MTALQVNGVRLDLETHEVACDGIALDISPIEFEILKVLMTSAGRIVSRYELARSLYSQPAGLSETVLDVHLHHLKRKLERGRRLIVKVDLTGYLFTIGDEHGPGNYQLA